MVAKDEERTIVEAKPATAALGARRSSPVVLVQAQVQMQMRAVVGSGNLQPAKGYPKRTCSIVCLLGGLSDWRIDGSVWSAVVRSEGKKTVEMEDGGQDEAKNDD